MTNTFEPTGKTREDFIEWAGDRWIKHSAWPNGDLDGFKVVKDLPNDPDKINGVNYAGEERQWYWPAIWQYADQHEGKTLEDLVAHAGDPLSFSTDCHSNASVYKDRDGKPSWKFARQYADQQEEPSEPEWITTETDAGFRAVIMSPVEDIEELSRVDDCWELVDYYTKSYIIKNISAGYLYRIKNPNYKQPKPQPEIPQGWVERLKGGLDNFKWQPIETAPKNGTVILVWSHDSGPVTMLYSENHFRDIVGFSRLRNVPTHWMPLPEPPSKKAGEDE